MDNLEAIPVGGVKDWFKGKIKDAVIAYLKPYWQEFTDAIHNSDWSKIGDLIDKIGQMSGYVELANAISAVLRDWQAKDFKKLLLDAATLWELISKLLPKTTPKNGGGGILVSAPAGHFSDPVAAEIGAMVDAAFGSLPAPMAGASGDPGGEGEAGPDGKPVEFGIVEIAAIASIAYTVFQFIRQRRQQKQK